MTHSLLQSFFTDSIEKLHLVVNSNFVKVATDEAGMFEVYAHVYQLSQ